MKNRFLKFFSMNLQEKPTDSQDFEKDVEFVIQEETTVVQVL